MRTVKVSNISKATSDRDIKEFLSFSGQILYVEMQRLVIIFYLFVLFGELLLLLLLLLLFLFCVEKLKILRLLMLHMRILKEQILQYF